MYTNLSLLIMGMLKKLKVYSTLIGYIVSCVLYKWRVFHNAKLFL